MKVVRKKWGKLEVVEEPVSLAQYRCLAVDVFSIAASLSNPKELFISAAASGIDVVFVLDAWHESHMPLARRYMELCRDYMIPCVLSERRPAEELAVELACARGCAVVTRDYDAVRRAEELNCDVDVVIQKAGRYYRVRKASSNGSRI
ncbi:hypothetical protein [Pyrobaculum sp.]|uniref:hypothetical protein n=1 Tax=Pyrobaculum sp. TaxID=2004705 RepID=UPI003F4FB7D0